MVRVAVCQLNADDGDVVAEWDRLVSYCRRSRPDLLLLPEMPFAPWLAARAEVDAAAWAKAVASHRRWLDRLGELDATVVVTSRPVTDDDGARFNEAVVWDADQGIAPAHRKAYLPDESGFFEASWYERGPTVFEPVETPVGTVGLLICTELWFVDKARHYGTQGADLLVCPRATPLASLDRWVAAGRVAAMCAGAFCLSSNRAGDAGPVRFAGVGWVTDPDGVVIARTTPAAPIVTVELDLSVSRHAKDTYPRYVDSTPVPPSDAGS